jgi:hypothetical protein
MLPDRIVNLLSGEARRGFDPWQFGGAD